MESHWKHEGEIYNPEYADIEHAGFIYLITNKETGMKYIGRKRFHKKRRLPPLKGRKNKRIRITESDWRDYCSSSEDVKADIKTQGKDNFDFEIISFHINFTELNYHETKLQFLLDVLEARDSEGNRKYYNRNIVMKFYPSEIQQEERRRLHESYLAISSGLSE